ncbi:probable isocitrate dehydrogenase [NAD] subunit beta, mitochondrial isoform X2 [Varroa jacobsoni]|uniref:Isocitrate dehydrogenase [NAD] subunit, mitochondrial n=1 Tax=Varroa destructor TaxID=109461 RepID=A0A7M7KPZ9_VARDE|nr:probable isocitrate dehydrogenase [NAD] subunit beta, mitochondrial isoform X2 [Varroa destructor]XP_022694622.1 probable isocitrate dehydrogenase [NAD] subunit beta, mitochondrial isoform X2 [Varroa jacobsoni]
MTLFHKIVSRLGYLAPSIAARTVGTSATNNLVAFHEPVSRPQQNIKCTLIPGDGVGPELAECVKAVFSAISVPIDFEEVFLSEIHHTISAPLETAIDSVKKNGICLKGTLETPLNSLTGELQAWNMKIRKDLDLFANVVHIKSMQGIKAKHNNLDFFVIREQTEGEYSALEHASVKGVIECLKIVTEEKSRRIAKFAFDYATKHDRKKVTAVHKANIMKLGDGLFLRCCTEISQLYPNIKFEHMIVDNTCMQLVSNPHQFDVIVTGNLYGNIVDNLASGLVGGAGVVPGASYSEDCVVYEPGSRHTFGGGAGKNVANPTAMLLCAAKMLHHVNLHYYAIQIRDAVEKVIKGGKVRTRDLGGYASTTDFLGAVISQLPH